MTSSSNTNETFTTSLPQLVTDNMEHDRDIDAKRVFVVQQTDMHLAIAMGLIPGVTVLDALGEREGIAIETNGEDIWRGSASIVPQPVDAGEQLEIVSSSSNDDGDPAGTGVGQVEVHYLVASGAEGSEIVTLNGQNGVALTEPNIRFVNDIHATDPAGALGVAAGNITVYKQGATTTIYSMIEIGGNRSLVPHRMVPLGKTLYLQGWHATEAQGKRNAIRLRSTDMQGVLLPGVFCFKDIAYLKQTTSGELKLHDKVPALSVVKVSSWADEINGEVSCHWWGYLVDD